MKQDLVSRIKLMLASGLVATSLAGCKSVSVSDFKKYKSEQQNALKKKLDVTAFETYKKDVIQPMIDSNEELKEKMKPFLSGGNYAKLTESMNKISSIVVYLGLVLRDNRLKDAERHIDLDRRLRQVVDDYKKLNTKHDTFVSNLAANKPIERDAIQREYQRFFDKEIKPISGTVEALKAEVAKYNGTSVDGIARVERKADSNTANLTGDNGLVKKVQKLENPTPHDVSEYQIAVVYLDHEKPNTYNATMTTPLGYISSENLATAEQMNLVPPHLRGLILNVGKKVEDKGAFTDAITKDNFSDAVKRQYLIIRYGQILRFQEHKLLTGVDGKPIKATKEYKKKLDEGDRFYLRITKVNK